MPLKSQIPLKAFGSLHPLVLLIPSSTKKVKFRFIHTLKLQRKHIQHSTCPSCMYNNHLLTSILEHGTCKTSEEHLYAFYFKSKLIIENYDKFIATSTPRFPSFATEGNFYGYTAFLLSKLLQRNAFPLKF